MATDRDEDRARDSFAINLERILAFFEDDFSDPI
jgi:hypothetical protein